MKGLSPTFMILISLLAFFSMEHRTCTARKSKKYWTQSSTKPTSRLHENGGITQNSDQQASTLMRELYHTTATQNAANSVTLFNVLQYGAKGDGTTDDTKAFEAAWADACKVQASTMMVPSGSVFLIEPITFSGQNCESNIIFQLEGKIIAPTNSEAWGSGLLQWLEFTQLNGITIRGKGIIDGQGSIWWNTNNSPTATGNLPNTKPTALRFYGSIGVTVTGIRIQNSQQTHLKFDNCQLVQVFDISVSSPGTSPNTDGIHLQNSQNVQIHNSNLACGDDCVSIQTGCSGIYIHNVICGPGHGISIGSLGKDNTKACVSNVTVRDITMHGTMTGVRIKTWQGGSGSVQGVMFANIQVSEVETPIMIDQYYCDGGHCNNHTSAVGVSAISFQNIKGTYTKTPVHLACSDSLPCIGVTLNTIQLTAKQESVPFCWQSYGKLLTETVPLVDCLESGKDSNYNVC